MSVSEDAMKAQPDVERGTESLQRSTKRTRLTWEDCADKINKEVCLDVLVSAADVMKFWRQLLESDENPHKARLRSVQASQIQKVIPWRQSSARESPQNPRETTKSRIVTPKCADAMRVSEHHTSTPCTRTQSLTIKRMVSKCHTRQQKSCDTLSAFLHD